MTKTTLDRHVLLTSEQKVEAADLRAMGFTRSELRALADFFFSRSDPTVFPHHTRSFSDHVVDAK
jgi:hypothetical protein